MKSIVSKEKSIQLFEEQSVRTHWDESQKKWFFSIVDVVAILTQQIDNQGARNYWKVLKHRLLADGNETVTDCNQLKMKAQDGKMRLTDVADTEQLLCLIQSIPSKKAEPFKMWLAKVGCERIQEIENPELAQERMKTLYEEKLDTFDKSKKIASRGGKVAGDARKQTEKELGRKVSTKENFLPKTNILQIGEDDE